MNNNAFNEIIFGSLFSEKNLIPYLDKKNTEYIYSLSKKYFLSGFILARCDFQNNPLLLKKLHTHNRKLALKKIVLLNDLRKLEENLKEKGINYVLMKGVAYERINLFNSSFRQFRDIDLLVDKADLKNAFKCILELDYEYETCLANKNCSYLYNKHHLPVLMNKNKTAIELHHRVTKPTIYKECPLTEHFLSTSERNNVPDISCLILHSMYHAIQHHQLKLGPIFLFDIAALIKSKKPHEKIDENLIHFLGLEFHYKQILSFINNLENKNVSKALHQYNLIVGDFLSDKKAKKYNFFLNRKGYTKITFSFVKEKMRFFKYKYQTDYLSLRFICALFFEIIKNFKKFRI